MTPESWEIESSMNPIPNPNSANLDSTKSYTPENDSEFTPEKSWDWNSSGWWFQICFIFTPTWANDPFD